MDTTFQVTTQPGQAAAAPSAAPTNAASNIELPPELLREIAQRIEGFPNNPVIRHNFSLASPIHKAAVVAEEKTLPDWIPYETFINKLSDRIQQIENPEAQEELTRCFETLSDLSRLPESFLTKEVRFFRALLSLSPDAFEHSVVSLMAKDSIAKTAYRYKHSLNHEELCKTLANVGNFALARTIFTHSYDSRRFASTFAKALVETGDMDHALQVFRSAPQSAETFEVLCKGYVDQNQLNKVVPLVQEFAQLSQDRSKAKSFVNLAAFLMNRGHFHEAIEVSKLIQNEEVLSSSIVNMCTIYILKGRTQEGLSLLRTMTRGKDWASVRQLVLSLIKNNLSNAAIQIAELIQDESIKDYCLYRISAKLFKENRAEAEKIAAQISNPKKILEEAFSRSFNILGNRRLLDEAPLHYLELILKMHLNNGRIEEACSLATTLIQKFNPRLLHSPILNFAKTLMERGYLDQAEALLKLMPPTIGTGLLENEILEIQLNICTISE